MKKLGFGLALSGVILAASAGAAEQAESSILGGAKQSPSFDGTTRKTVDEFIDAYINRNPAGLARVTTGDFEVRFDLARTGTHIILDEDALVDSWRDAGVNSKARDGRSAVDIFPTADAHVVFVTYRIAGNAGSERIALLELRGDKIARAQDIAGPAPTLPERAAWTKNIGTVAADRDSAERR
jgi:hypothetical protein